MKSKKSIKTEKSISIFARPWFVIALVITCFAILTPKIFLPLLRQLFGYGTSKETSSLYGEDLVGEGFAPPNLRNRGSKIPNPSAFQETSGSGPGADFARSGPQFGRQAYAPSQTTGVSKSVLSYLLPVYAIGIGIYMIYTLCKVFNKGKLISFFQNNFFGVS